MKLFCIILQSLNFYYILIYLFIWFHYPITHVFVWELIHLWITYYVNHKVYSLFCKLIYKILFVDVFYFQFKLKMKCGQYYYLRSNEFLDLYRKIWRFLNPILHPLTKTPKHYFVYFIYYICVWKKLFLLDSPLIRWVKVLQYIDTINPDTL